MERRARERGEETESGEKRRIDGEEKGDSEKRQSTPGQSTAAIAQEVISHPRIQVSIGSISPPDKLITPNRGTREP